MKELSEEIVLFENCIEKYCPFLYEKLQVPDIGRVKKLILDPQLQTMYGWKNGFQVDEIYPTSAFDISGFGIIPSLDYIEKVLEVKDITRFWRSSYFPIVADLGGDYLLYESDKDAETYGSISLYSPNLGHVYELVSIYDSLELMLKSFRINFEEKAVVYDVEEHFLDINYDPYFEISGSLNPNSGYWKKK